MTSFDPLEPRRLFAAGQLDSSFGGDGSVEVKINLHSWRPTVTDVVADDQGRSLLAGFYRAKQQISLTRLNVDGSVDATFGTNGIATVKLKPADKSTSIFQIAADHAGRPLLIIGTKLIRLTVGGAMDSAFGTAGSVRPPVVSALRDVAVDAKNRPLIFGSVVGKTGDRTTVVCLDERGQLDRTFGGGTGAYKSPVPAGPDGTPGFSSPDRIKALADGTILGVSVIYKDTKSSYGANGISAFRLDANGTIDKSYGTNGSMDYTKTDDDFTKRSTQLVAISAKGAMITANSESGYESSNWYGSNTYIDPRGRVKRDDFDIVPRELQPKLDYTGAIVLGFQPDDKPVMFGSRKREFFRMQPGFAYDNTFKRSAPVDGTIPYATFVVTGTSLLQFNLHRTPDYGVTSTFSVAAIALA